MKYNINLVINRQWYYLNYYSGLDPEYTRFFDNKNQLQYSLFNIRCIAKKTKNTYLHMSNYTNIKITIFSILKE